jgi:hypothetical protein
MKGALETFPITTVFGGLSKTRIPWYYNPDGPIST